MNDNYDDEIEIEYDDDEYYDSSSPSRKKKSRKPVQEKVGKTVENSGTAMQAAGKTTEAVGKTTEVAGKAAQVAGKGVSAAGDGLMHAGSALSGTGIGAIVGAPLTGLGAVTKGAGEATNAVGKGAEVAGKGINKAGKKLDKSGKNVKETGKNISNNGKNQRNSAIQNPALNHNRFKGFGRNDNKKDPKVNSSSSILNGTKSFFGRNKNKSSLGLGTLFGKRKKRNGSALETVDKKVNLNIISLFMALPIYVKIAIIGSAGILFLLFIVIIFVILIYTSSTTGDRELKDSYINGSLTEEELCDYLDRNGYLDAENITECENSPAYQFYVNFKNLKEDYEETYSQNRISINVELLYETLAYYYADDETLIKTKEEDINNLMDAMVEEIEESCIIKTYNKTNGTCSTTKYVYTLNEFSLDKYISYLKYGNTSSHPNYNNQKLKRTCGTGKNVDYVFGYGLVNTSSSPLNESSDCPNNPVKESDYNDSNITVKRTSLEELNSLGGVPYYSHVNYGDEVSDEANISNDASNQTVVGSGTGAEIAKYAVQFVGNPYVWGGTSLTNGADCSGFIMSVYANFGYSLPHSAQGISTKGSSVECNTSSLQAGDVIAYGSNAGDITHAAIYIGDGKIVHAMGAKYGIVVSNWDYSSKSYRTCRRIAN